MNERALHILIPDDWSDDQAKILGDRLAEKELPPDLTMLLTTRGPITPQDYEPLKVWVPA